MYIHIYIAGHRCYLSGAIFKLHEVRLHSQIKITCGSFFSLQISYVKFLNVFMIMKMMMFKGSFSSINHLKVPQIYKHPALPKIGKSKKSFRDLKEALLTEELSDGSRGKKGAAEVPRGFLAVYVGPELRRFVIPASYLSHPAFRDLMERVAEEFGFEQEGGLKIPCEEEVFEEVLLRCLTNNRLMSKNRRKKNN